MQNTSKSVATRIAENICSFNKDHITPRAMIWAQNAIIDTIGCALAGASQLCTTLLMKTPGICETFGPSLIMGTSNRVSMLDAALLNGTAAHALDFDDVNGVMGGHPSAPLLPAIFALAEGKNLSGSDFLTAYVAGYELEIRLARAVHLEHYNKGWHPTATLGTFGAAAASAHLLGLDIPKTAKAIALAASFASGIKANFGTMTKPLHVGHCARNGLLAALLVESGYESNPAALESEQGFFLVYNGPNNYNFENIFKNWASPLEIESNDNGLKQFPCCGSTHPSITMMLQLVNEENITADDVINIEILTHANRLPHTDNPNPQGSLAGKFSIQYVVARALVDGVVRLEHFKDEAVGDRHVRSIMNKIAVSCYPELHADVKNQWGAEVTVNTKDGRRLSRRVEKLVCRGPLNAMSEDELFEKFSGCAIHTLNENQLAPLFEFLQKFEKINNINTLSSLLEPRKPPERFLKIYR